MLGINKSSKTIDINIVDEKYYFPGQTIKGTVNVQPKNPTKTNHIVIKFTGEVSLSLKEKDTTCLFQKTQILNVNSDDKSTAKGYILEPKLYSFPFEFVVPDDIQLPSTMEFNKKARVRYTLSALHDKSMVPESLCPKADYPVHILEFIDINDKIYKVPQNESSQILLPKSNPVNRCGIRGTLPRYGFTRGDIVPLSLVINHYQPFCLPEGIDISLVRTVEIRNNKNIQVKEDVLKSTKCDIEINMTPHSSQTMKRQLLIPTSTPPSIQFRNGLLRIQYKVRIRAQLSNQDSSQDTCNVDIPIVVGTWPRASIPIDDDDDDDDNDNQATLEEDTEFIELTNSISGSENYQNDSRSITSDNRNSSSIMLSESRNSPTVESFSHNSSSSTIKLTAKSSTLSDSGMVARSDSKSSNKSHTSYSSYRSNQSWDKSSPSLSRNTSLSTSISMQESTKSTNAIPVNVLTPTSDTIVMTASLSHTNSNVNFNNNTTTTSTSSNRSVSTLYQHRGSDPSGMANHATSNHHRHSFSERDQQYPVFIGPSPSNYQSRSLSPPPYSSNSSSSGMTVMMTPPPQPSATLSSSSSSISSSFFRDEASTSTHRSLRTASPTPITMLSPVNSPSLLFATPQHPPPSNSTIMLKPVNDVDDDDFIQRRAPEKQATPPSVVAYNDVEQHSDSDSEDDDEDFLTIVKRKQEQHRLNGRSGASMAEMKT